MGPGFPTGPGLIQRVKADTAGPGLPRGYQLAEFLGGPVAGVTRAQSQRKQGQEAQGTKAQGKEVQTRRLLGSVAEPSPQNALQCLAEC